MSNVAFSVPQTSDLAFTQVIFLSLSGYVYRIRANANHRPYCTFGARVEIKCRSHGFEVLPITCDWPTWSAVNHEVSLVFYNQITTWYHTLRKDEHFKICVITYNYKSSSWKINFTSYFLFMSHPPTWMRHVWAILQQATRGRWRHIMAYILMGQTVISAYHMI